MGQRQGATKSRAAAVDRLSREDARILKLEHGAISGHSCKVLVLERTGDRPLPSIAQIREHIASRLDDAPRLRQRLVPTPLRLAEPVWCDDPEFDIARHVTLVPAREPVGRSGLEEIVGRLIGQRLDRAHPLWKVEVVERVEEDSMALVWRVHHCLADGTASLRLCDCVLWTSDAEVAPCVERAWTPQPAPRAVAMIVQALSERVRRAPAAAGAASAKSSLRLMRQTFRRELRPGAAKTPFDARAGSSRAVAFAVVPFESARAAGKAVDEAITVNDVVLGIIAGGVRAWLDRGLGPADGIRVKIPVSLHHSGEDPQTANRDSYFFVDLPVAEPDMRKRLLAINRETAERKLDHDAETLYRLGQHPFVARWAMSPRVFTFNVSNVHGPSGDVFVVGARVREMYSLAEIAQHHVLRVAVISAAGQLSFGLCADADAVKDVGMIAEGIRRAADELVSAPA